MRLPLRLGLAWALYALAAALWVNDFGVVGEVAAAWSAETTPDVVVAWTPQGPQGAEGLAWGPLHAAQVRPVERLTLGGVSLPLAVNSYTGGPPDWPARAVYAVTRSAQAVGVLHLALGAVLIGLVHRFLRFHGSREAAPVAALLLATDWSFVFYREVLGGTELLLQAAGLLALWSFWSRRWAGGRHGSEAFAVAVGLGLVAKATFLATLGALGLAIALTRWDRPRLKAPNPPRWGRMALWVGLLTAPLWLTWIHHRWAFGDSPRVVSHDRVDLQVERAVQGLEALWGARRGPEREASPSLRWFLLEPLAWVNAALGSQAPPVAGFWRLLGLGLALGGTVLEWVSRSNSPSGALLRFVSLYAPLQLGALWLANRDLHHLAQATPTLVIWAALALDRLASTQGGARSVARAVLAGVLALPWMIGGARSLSQTDAALAQIQAPMLRRSGQEQLGQLLERCDARPLWTSDYELYGALEVVRPGWPVRHAWGDVSRRFGEREQALEALLQGAVGGSYLVVRPSAPMIYNLSPSPAQLAEAAQRAGVTVTRCGGLADTRGEWATVYQIGP